MTSRQAAILSPGLSVSLERNLSRPFCALGSQARLPAQEQVSSWSWLPALLPQHLPFARKLARVLSLRFTERLRGGPPCSLGGETSGRPPCRAHGAGLPWDASLRHPTRRGLCCCCSHFCGWQLRGGWALEQPRPACQRQRERK